MNMHNQSETQQILKPIDGSASAKWSYVSLMFSLFFFFPLIMTWQNVSLQNIAAHILIYGAFIFCFIMAIRRVGKQTYGPISGIIVIAAIGSSITAGSGSLFGYATFLSSYYLDRTKANLFLLFNLSTQLLAALAFDLMHLYFLGPSVAVTLSLYVYGRFSQKDCFAQLRAQQQNQHIEELAAIAERERIARDMHDLLGHSLSSLALKSELAQKLLQKGREQDALQEIQQVAQLARDTLAEVREAVTGLKHQSLSHNIEKLSVQLSNLGYNTKTQVNLPPLNAKVESCLNMLCKEWITNILRHSEGDEVDISVNYDKQNIQLTINDNGNISSITPGNGIEGMKSRIKELKGDFSLNLKNGVSLMVTLPYELEGHTT